MFYYDSRQGLTIIRRLTGFANKAETATRLPHRIASLYLGKSIGDALALVGASPSEGSFGDEGLQAGATAELVRRGRQAETQSHELQRMTASLTRLSRDITTLRAKHLATELQGVGRLALLGADVMDGAYGLQNSVNRLRFLRLVASKGACTSLVSFSFSRAPSGQLQRELLHAADAGVRFSPRDPRTYDRLVPLLQAAIDPASPDLAFLAPAAANFPRRYPAGSIGFNLSRTALQMVGEAPNRGIVRFSHCIRELLRDEEVPHVVLIPHDRRGDPSDFDLAGRVSERLHEEVLSGKVSLFEPSSYAEVKSAVRQLAGVVSCRMHLSIAALSQGVPAHSLSYQGKVEGLYEVLRLPLQTFQLPEIFEVDALRKLLSDMRTVPKLTSQQVDGWSSAARGHIDVVLR